MNDDKNFILLSYCLYFIKSIIFLIKSFIFCHISIIPLFESYNNTYCDYQNHKQN